MKIETGARYWLTVFRDYLRDNDQCDIQLYRDVEAALKKVQADKNVVRR